MYPSAKTTVPKLTSPSPARIRTVDSLALATMDLKAATSLWSSEIWADAGAAARASTRAVTRERAVIGRDSENVSLGDGWGGTRSLAGGEGLVAVSNQSSVSSHQPAVEGSVRSLMTDHRSLFTGYAPFLPRVTGIVVTSVPRRMVSRTTSPGFLVASSSRNFLTVLTSSPLNLVIVSPAFSPALPAGVSGSGSSVIHMSSSSSVGKTTPRD